MPEKKPPRPWIAAALFFCLFTISLGLQIRSGAWESDFGGHADEAAHVVTSLMVRDYLAGGILEIPHPLRYAEAYYDRYPKVAIGHYPPGFYGVAGIALLPFRNAGTLLVLMAMLSAAAGLATWTLGRRLLESEAGAVSVGLLVCLLPMVRTYTAIVMADLLLMVFFLLAVAAFARFLEQDRARDSLGFGLFASAAILTKGSGLALGLLPLLAIPLSGKWNLFRSPRLWVAPIPVFLLALPWMLFTMGITAEGMQEGSLSDYLGGAVPYYGAALVREAGWIALAGITLGLILFVSRRRHFRLREAFGLAAVVALPLCVLALTLTLPSGLDERYLMPLFPPLLLLAAWGLEAVASELWPPMRKAVVPLLALLIFVETWRPVEKRFTGATEVVQMLLDEGGGTLDPAEPARLLVVSDAGGEGALVAAAAFRGMERLSVSRASKLLASSDWLGRGYRINFESSEDLMGILGEHRIRFLAVDSPPQGPMSSEHWRLVDGYLSGREFEGGALVGEVESLRKVGGSVFRVFRIEGEE